MLSDLKAYTPTQNVFITTEGWLLFLKIYCVKGARVQLLALQQKYAISFNVLQFFPGVLVSLQSATI